MLDLLFFPTRILLALLFITTHDSRPTVSRDTQQIMEGVEKQRHLAMIEAGISSFDARNLSLLGSLTFENRICGDKIVSESDIDKVWKSIKSPNINEETRKLQTSAYADALSNALSKINPTEKNQICQSARNGVVNLKRDWGIK
jgi:hypothetical protein